ncbi:hypothetical protein ACQX0N_00760 [Clostridium tepidum]|jgi:hypothetical protein|uniref:Uncharacterized protein n=1 Tax=Clostridium tepidum TaxID=1962263 RepID=A0A1S9IAB8_9CLOT|nr:hypothetical protein [Clostridium tepidum]MCR1934751.1 hypothetical protein [Clostridium tepidum]MDU6878296.1 hypothetical protein [Clostridium botulinum]OOO62185.1 hypothetical protein BS637_08685 [Clostridium tepidum]OOO67203.1 hypothetical protein BS638_05850 [Clostridium tepidum]
MKKKQIIILILLGILILLSSLGISYYKNNEAFIGILFSDASMEDSELKILNENFHNKKSIRLDAMDAPMVSYINNSVYIPTSLDNKLFYINNNFEVSEQKVDHGSSFIRSKKDGQLILFNLPRNKINGDNNRVYFSYNNKKNTLDIEKSLLLCGDFDNKYIYVIGAKFDSDTNTETYLFIIDRASFKLVKEEKLPTNIRVICTELIDNKLFISSDTKVDYFLYYDILNKKIEKINYNKLIKNSLDISKIVYDENNIFLASLTGDIVKLDRKKLIINDVKTLNDRRIIGADIKDNKLYLLNKDEENRRVAKVNVLDASTLKQIKEISVGPIRNTMPQDIFIYK